ncbi:interleukin-10 receptor subunit beta [Pogona vitticeps]
MARGAWHCLLCCGVFLWAAYGIVPEPQNLRVHSDMLESILQWDPPNFHKENVTYRVQHRKDYDNTFTDLCNRTEVTECNVSRIQIYGSSFLRVRTEFQNNTSNWVCITFTPLADTKISPPDIQVEVSQPSVLSVQLTDPYFIHNGARYSIKVFYSTVAYRIHIWKKNYSDKQDRKLNTSFTFETISGLEPGTTYCLKAQAFIEEFNKSGEWSEPFCVRTSNASYAGINPVLLILILPLVLILFSCCCFMIFRIYRRIKYVFFPSYSLPQHFKEFLNKPSYSSQFLTSQIQGEDYTYEKITILSEELKNGGKESEEQLNNAKQQLKISQEETYNLKTIQTI